MSPIEKAEAALNRRIERIQANLRDTRAEQTQGHLVQALVITLGLGEGLGDYARAIGEYAQGRHAELKRLHAELGAQHTAALQAGTGLLERLKATPSDRSIRKEIERTQQAMAAIQKTLRRGAHALQRELAPGMAMIDALADAVRHLSEAEQPDALQRATRRLVGLADELYRKQPTLPARNLLDAAAWEKSALAEIDQATDLHDAYARAGHQALMALALMTLAVSSQPPLTSADAIQRAGEAATGRMKAIMTRLSAG